MIERILQGVFPYDEHGDITGRSVLIVKPSMFSPETTVNIGWTIDAQGGYEISDFPEERPFLPLPQTLSLVYTADLDAANTRMAELEAENAALRRQQWKPICEETIPTSHPDGDGVGTTVSTECAPELWGSRQSIQISTWDDSGFYHASIVLPDDIRLCRKVGE